MNTHEHHQHHHRNYSEEFEIKVSTSPELPEIGKPLNIVIEVTKDGKIASLDVVHEMKIHLLIVNDQLTWFDHIHPHEQNDGTFVAVETFPFSGKYLLFMDYKPTEGAPDVHVHELNLAGEKVLQSLQMETSFVSTVDGFTVTLINGDDFKTKRKQALKFSVEKEGKMLSEKDMENYLGASAHIVMISRADKDFLHIHPISDGDFPIYAETRIEQDGMYRIWVQFKVDGIVRTADFTVKV